MNLFRAFMELDEINEGLSRQEMISRLRALGKRYNFDKFPDKQLYGMLRDAEEKKAKEKVVKKADDELDLDFEPAEDFACCDFCGMRLNALDQCPVCDLGEEDLNEQAKLVEFVTASGKQVKIPKQATAAAQAKTNNAPDPNSTVRTITGKYKVGIVLDKGRLRAMANDGVHGIAFVSFPNHLRQFEGQHYEVDQLIWNGKNYRVAGNIEEV